MATVSGTWNVHVVADSDTRWKWGAALARRLAPDAEPHLRATFLRGRSAPTERQLLEVGTPVESMRHSSLAELIPQVRETDAHLVVLACAAGTVQSLLHALARAWETRPTRPVVVTGYVGLVYERTVDGVLLRAGADVVLANSATDADRFRAVFEAVDVDPDSVVQTALPFLGGAPHDPRSAGRDRPFTVTFVTQPGVPQTKAERRYALRQVIEHAMRHPDRRVIVKLRGRVGERTTHVEPYHYTSLLPARELPRNVELVYGPMACVLDRTDLCVTVSSTAALEAMHRDIPTAILIDFGIRENLGNHVFLGSGALTSWRALHAGAMPKIDAGWAARNGLHQSEPCTALVRRVEALTNPDEPLPPLRPWLNAADAAGYLPGLLSRHGLDEYGVPLTAVARRAAATSLPRRALRATARRAYEFGVRALEPRVKRLAQM